MAHGGAKLRRGREASGNAAAVIQARDDSDWDRREASYTRCLGVKKAEPWKQKWRRN